MVTSTQIYNALYSLFNNAEYPKVVHDSTTRLRTENGTAVPASVEINELQSTFGTARNHRTDRIDHQTWSWEVYVSFNSIEVSFDKLRELLSHMTHVSDNGMTARIRVERAKYTHPPRQEPATGSRAEFLLIVNPHPV